MKNDLINNMIKGWFVGDFEPSAFTTENCEVALKKYKAGDCEDEHYHKIATEITLVISGKVNMAGKTWVSGSIIVLEPGESTSFQAVEESLTVVVKVPGAKNDKYFVG